MIGANFAQVKSPFAAIALATILVALGKHSAEAKIRPLWLCTKLIQTWLVGKESPQIPANLP